LETASNRIDELADRVQEEVDSGRSLGAQFAIARGSSVIAEGWFGDAGPDTRFCLFSATKALVSATCITLIESGHLDPARPVAHYIPEFAENGKGAVLVEHVMLMQGGFPYAPMGPKHWGSSAGRREKMASWRLDWAPGTRCAYHPMAAHWVLAELISTVTSRSHVDVVHDALTRPLGLEPVLGPSVLADPCHDVRSAGERPADSEIAEVLGGPQFVMPSSVGLEALLVMNDTETRRAGVPGGGGFARAGEIALVYQRMLSLPASAFEVRNTMVSETDNVVANRSLAFVLAGSDGFAAHRWMAGTSPRAFGHMGAGGQIAWADPESGLSFCFLHDTLHQDPRVDFVRSRDLSTLASRSA
jgi:CubicO group peptidase (beta-lactamase class C family)